MKTIRYRIYSLLLVIAFAGCSEAEGPVPEDDEWVAIELVGLGGAVQVTRAEGEIDPSLTEVNNATIIVFHATDDRVLQNKTIDYAGGERVYLKRGDTYRVFVFANLTDANCPEEFTAADYFEEVDELEDLDDKYYISSVEQAGEAPKRMPMISGSITDALQEVELPERLALDENENYPVITLPLRSLYTKVAVNIYNKVDGGGTNLSGVELVSYYANNIPTYCWIVERAGEDYPQSSNGYQRSSLTNIALQEKGIVEKNEGWYRQYSFDIYCLENRRGDVKDLEDWYERKALAPEYAFEVSFQGNIKADKRDDVLQTYVVVGKGEVDNFDVDRNCIYTVNAYVNSTTHIDMDSRRMYLNVAINGELESPEEGTEGYF